MFKRRLKVCIGSFLLVLMSMGLTISTFHSHHHFEWEHPKEFADTGNCINKDTTLCPINGHILQTDLPATDYSGELFFNVDEVVTENDLIVSSYEININRGRSPPAA
jgi:hypothetical protein